MGPDAAPASARFWQGQFRPDRSLAALAFDGLAGIALPAALCPMLLDELGNEGFVVLGRVFYMTAAAVGGVTLGLCLARGIRLAALAAWVAGVLAAGSLYALLPLGLLLVSVAYVVRASFADYGRLADILSAVLFMAFAAIPFAALLLAYLRNALGALRYAGRRAGAARAARAAMCGLAFGLGTPALAQAVVSRVEAQAVEAILLGDAEAADTAALTLRRLGWLAEPDRLVRLYQGETTPETRARLARAYRLVTDGDIADRARVLS